MQRTKQMGMVKKLADDFERRKAEALATAERRVTEAEKKLSDLESYRDGYVKDFAVRCQAGIGAAAARDYQAFLSKLEDAMQQQAKVIEGTRTQRDAERQHWQSAAQRAEVIGQTIKRWEGEEQHALDRREQRESDERSARIWAQGMSTRGA